MKFNPEFYDHEVVQRSPDDYVEMTMSPDEILKAWQLSMFAHELMNKDGTVKPANDMHSDHLKKYLDVSDMMNKGDPIPKPIIGIGVMDNVEIGVGREVVVVARELGVKILPFHVRKAQAKDIESLF